MKQIIVCCKVCLALKKLKHKLNDHSGEGNILKKEKSFDVHGIYYIINKTVKILCINIINIIAK